jgi:hypothetical protein
MDVKELALLLSPLVAVLVAVATIVFNLFDRRRHYALERERLSLEREKIAKEMAKALLSGAKSFEKRTEVYNDLMLCISEVTAVFRRSEAQLSAEGQARFADDELKAILARLLSLVRSNQVFTTRYIHEALTEGYVMPIMRVTAKWTEAQNESPGRAETGELASPT